MGKPKISDEKINEMKRLYEAGVPKYKIIRQLGISSWAANKYLPQKRKPYNVTKIRLADYNMDDRIKITKEMEEEMREMREKKHYSYVRIAAAFNVHPYTVRYHLVEGLREEILEKARERHAYSPAKPYNKEFTEKYHKKKRLFAASLDDEELEKFKSNRQKRLEEKYNAFRKTYLCGKYTVVELIKKYNLQASQASTFKERVNREVN